MLLASSVGVAIYQTLYSTFLKSEFTSIAPEVLAVANKYGALKNYLFIRDMPVEYQQPIIHAYMEALNSVFIVPIVAGGVGVICAVCVRNVRFGGPKKPAASEDVEGQTDKTELQQAPSVSEEKH